VPGSAAPWAAASYGVNWYGELADRHRHAGELLDQAVARASGLAVRSDVLVGGPARELAAIEADLVVVGSRRRGPLRRIAFGSTSEALIRHAHTPVLVAPGSVVDERSVSSARADAPGPTP
jgi:nucleotide-binding universal stress UspA family protein